jgi:hypothetical protein
VRVNCAGATGGLIVERLRTLEEVKVLGRVAENADPIYTVRVRPSKHYLTTGDQVVD